MNGLSQKVYDFVDERIDLKTLEAKMMNEPIKGGSRWAYIFGSCLLFIFIMQAITGMLLMFYYIPSADHAYASTQFIIHEVDYGWFILSYHFWGSSARSEEHTSELQSQSNLVCRLLLEKKNKGAPGLHDPIAARDGCTVHHPVLADDAGD